MRKPDQFAAIARWRRLAPVYHIVAAVAAPRSNKVNRLHANAAQSGQPIVRRNRRLAAAVAAREAN